MFLEILQPLPYDRKRLHTCSKIKNVNYIGFAQPSVLPPLSVAEALVQFSFCNRALNWGILIDVTFSSWCCTPS